MATLQLGRSSNSQGHLSIRKSEKIQQGLLLGTTTIFYARGGALRPASQGYRVLRSLQRLLEHDWFIGDWNGNFLLARRGILADAMRWTQLLCSPELTPPS